MLLIPVWRLAALEMLSHPEAARFLLVLPSTRLGNSLGETRCRVGEGKDASSIRPN
jgi:hypothetical protein